MNTLATIYARQCYGKTRHNEKGDAQLSAQRMERLERQPMTIYQCPCCGGYHVGHKKPSTDRGWGR